MLVVEAVDGNGPSTGGVGWWRWSNSHLDLLLEQQIQVVEVLVIVILLKEEVA
jgi:hypothetical protein